MKLKDVRLVRACRAGDLEAARAAIEAGADVNVRFAKSRNSPLFTAVDGNEADIVALLVASGADVNARSADGLPLLLLACTHGVEGGALHLLRGGADPNARWPEHSNETPLHLAHDPDLVRALLEAGADVNAQDVRGRTALMQLALASEWESARLLIAAGADTRMTDSRGRTARDLFEEAGPKDFPPPPDVATALDISTRPSMS